MFSIFNKLSLPSHLNALLYPGNHSAAMTGMRAALIVSRVQQIALLLSLLTVGWIVVDAICLPWSLWSRLAVGRLFAGAALAMLGAGTVGKQETLSSAYRALAALFFIPLVFLFFAVYLFHIFENKHALEPFAGIYYFAPFVVAAGVSFFPMTLIESALLLVLPMSVGMLAYINAFTGMLGAYQGYEMLWILVLVLMTSALAGASQVGFLLEMFKDTAHDALTGLYVRKVGEAMLNQQFAAALRNDSPFSVLFLDIDFFKNINDRFGHDAGDQVLRSVASQLRLVLRRQDMAIRWGGEEFLIVLPNTDQPQVEEFLNRLAVEGLCTNTDGTLVTASFGVAERKIDRMQDWQSLVNLADKRLYVAKCAGRNRYVLQEDSCLWLKNLPVS